MRHYTSSPYLIEWSLAILLLSIPHYVWGQYDGKCFTSDDAVEKKTIHVSIQKDTVIALETDREVTTLLVSGNCSFLNEESCVRILLRDNYNYEHLIYENYPLLAGSGQAVFNDIALETALLDKSVLPKDMVIRIKDATLHLSSVSYGSGQPKEVSVNAIRKEQCSQVAKKLNENLVRLKIPWRAASNRITEYSFEEKKSMFGGEVPFLYGFDYYAYGIFIMPGMHEQLRQSVLRNDSSQYVREWDWRNRHGKNWLTSIKDQNTCASCWAFAAVGVIEAYFNLYYNRPVNYDLSEQEIISCNGVYGCGNGDPGAALQYVKSNGLVKESCFHYMGYAADCSLKCQNPDDIIQFDDFDYIANLGEDTIKSHVVKAPITMTARSFSHVMTLVGFKVLEEGDVIHGDIGCDADIDPIYDGVVINSTYYPECVGANAWLVKNSWGTSWGTNGYGYIFTGISDIYQLHSLNGAINSSLYNEDDVLCEDADGDGYYFWGIGPKPDNCPWWVPDEPDGDDSDILLGPMDQYGNIVPVNPSSDGVTHIYSTQTITADTVFCHNVIIHRDATLTVTDNVYFHHGAKLIVHDGGTVNIDGGNVIFADMNLADGGRLKISNGGKVIPFKNTPFTVALGASLQIDRGTVIRRE